MTEQTYKECLAKYNVPEILYGEYADEDYARCEDLDGLICLRGEQLQKAGASNQEVRDVMHYLAERYCEDHILRLSESLKKKGFGEEEIRHLVSAERAWYGRY